MEWRFEHSAHSCKECQMFKTLKNWTLYPKQQQLSSLVELHWRCSQKVGRKVRKRPTFPPFSNRLFFRVLIDNERYRSFARPGNKNNLLTCSFHQKKSPYPDIRYTYSNAFKMKIFQSFRRASVMMIIFPGPFLPGPPTLVNSERWRQKKRLFGPEKGKKGTERKKNERLDWNIIIRNLRIQKRKKK